MTPENITNLKILANEAMVTAIADYKYYTSNGEVVPPIEVTDTITNVWVKDDNNRAGRHINADEVKSARINPTGAVLSDYINSLARDFVVNYIDVDTTPVNKIVDEGTKHILTAFNELQDLIDNIENDKTNYRFLIRPEPEYLKELFLYFAKNGCQMDIEEFANVRLNTDMLVDRPYLTSKPITREDLVPITTVIYWSKYEYGDEDYNVGKWLALLLAKIVDAIRKEELVKIGALTVEENIKTIPVIEFFTPYVGKVWEYEELLDKLGETEKIFTLDNVTNTQIGKQEIFQFLEIQAMKYKTPYTCIENSNIGMFITKISSLLKYLTDDDVMMLRINLEKYKRLKTENYYSFREEAIRSYAGSIIDNFKPGIEVPNFDVPPIDNQDYIYATLPTIEEAIAKYEELKEKESTVSDTFIATDAKYPYTTDVIVNKDPDVYSPADEDDDHGEEYDPEEGGVTEGDPTTGGTGDNDFEDGDEGDVPGQGVVSGDGEGDTHGSGTGRTDSDREDPGHTPGEQGVHVKDEGGSDSDGDITGDSHEGTGDTPEETVIIRDPITGEPIEVKVADLTTSISFTPKVSEHDKARHLDGVDPEIPFVINIEDK